MKNEKELIKKIIKEEVKKIMKEDDEFNSEEAPADQPHNAEPVAIRPSTGDMRYAATLKKYYEHLSHENMLMESGMELFKKKLVVINPEEIKEICANIRMELSKIDDILNKTARS